MKAFIFTAILSLTLLVPQTGRAQAGVPADSMGQWNNDVEALMAKLKEIHPRFRTCGLPPEIDSAKRSLVLRLASLADAQIVVELQRLLAAAGDGHTLLYPFGMKRGTLLRLPVMLWLFDDGLYVVDAQDPQFVGLKVKSIGRSSADEVLKNLAPYISRDNTQQMRWASPFYCTLTDFLAAINAIDSRDSAVIEFANGAKHTFIAGAIDPEKLELKLVSSGNGPAYLLHRAEPFRTEEVQPGVLYVAVNAMNDSPGRSLETFGKELRSLLKPYGRMILDLRLNNGGEASKADELFKTCVAFNVRGGKLAVLTGRMTFSAAQTFAARIDQWTDAIFVGEATGSKPNHYGNERSFKLPFSGLRGSISSGYNQPVSANDNRIAIIPEIAVPSNAADHFAGKDPVIGAALKALADTVKYK